MRKNIFLNFLIKVLKVFDIGMFLNEILYCKENFYFYDILKIVGV